MNCKKLLLLTCAIMAIAMVSIVAETTDISDADTTDYNLWIMGVQVTSDNMDDVLGDGKISVAYRPESEGEGITELMTIYLTAASGDDYKATSSDDLHENAMIYSSYDTSIVIEGLNSFESDLESSIGIKCPSKSLSISEKTNVTGSVLCVTSSSNCIAANDFTSRVQLKLVSKSYAISCTSQIYAPALIKGNSGATSSTVSTAGYTIRASKSLEETSLGAYSSTEPDPYRVIFIDLEGVYVNGTRITEENKDNIPLPNGTGSYDFGTNTLTLDGALINAGFSHICTADPSLTTLGIYSSYDMTIVVKNECTVNDGYGIFVLGTLTLTTDSTGTFNTTADIISPGTFSISNTDSEDTLELDLYNSTTDVTGSIESWNNIVILKSTLSITGDAASSKGLSANHDIRITNTSTVNISKCDEITAAHEVMISNSTVYIGETETVSGGILEFATAVVTIDDSTVGLQSTVGDITFGATTLNIKADDTGIKSKGNIVLSGDTIDIDAGLTGISAESGITVTNAKLEIDVDQTMFARGIYVRTGNLTMSADSEFLSASYVKIKFNSGNTTCYGIYAGDGTDMTDVSVGCHLWIESTSSTNITGIKCGIMTVLNNGTLDLSLKGTSSITCGIDADTVALNDGSTISIDIEGASNTNSTSYGIKTSALTSASDELTVYSLSKGQSSSIYVSGDATMTDEKISLKSTSTTGESDGIYCTGNVALTCSDFKIGMNGNSYGDVTYGINANTASLNVTGEIQSSSSDLGCAVKTVGTMSMNGTGTLNLYVAAARAYGVIAANLTLSDSMTLNFSSTATNPPAGSFIIAIMVTSSVTVNNSAYITIKAKGAPTNKGIESGSLTMNGGSALIEANTAAITCTNPITASGYTVSHSQDPFVSGTTMVLVPIPNETMRFAVSIDIVIQSNNTEYGTVSTENMTVPAGSVVHIDSSTPNMITIARNESTAQKTDDTSAYSYAFDSWSVADGTVITSSTTITATFTCTAKVYNIKLMLNGGTSSYVPEGWRSITESETVVGYEMDIEYGKPINKISDPFKAGYRFSEWNPQIPDSMCDSNIVCSAVYEANKNLVMINIAGYNATVNYKLNDGDPIVYDPANPPMIEYETIVTIIPSSVFGYTYAVTISTTCTDDYQFTMPDEMVTVSIMYTANQHNVTINTNGGSYTATPEGWTPIEGKTGEIVAYERTLSFGQTLSDFIPAGPVKKGYTFENWDPVPPATMPDNDLDLTAKYHINSYEVTIYTEGGSGQVFYRIGEGAETLYSSPFNVDYGGYVSVRAGDLFEHTSELLSDDVVLDEGAFYMPDGAVTISAVYTANPYELTLMLNGGHYETAPEGWTPIYSNDSIIGYSKEFGYGKDIVISETPTMTGYSFLKWDPQLPATMPNKALTATAQYAINDYTVTFAVTGATGTMRYTIGTDGQITDYTGPFSVTYGKTITVIPFESEHMHDVTTSEQTEIKDYSFDVPGCDVTVNVDYKLNTHLVILRLNGGYYENEPEGWDVYTDYTGKSAGYQKEYEYGATVTIPGDPLMTGYIFKGWDPSASTVTTMPDSKVILDAKFNITSFNVTLVPEEGMTLYYRINDGETKQYTEPITVTYNYSVTVTADEKSGYMLTLDSEDMTIYGTSFKVPAKDITVSAHYEISYRMVTVTSQLPNAAIYYSVDGRESQLYTSAFMLNPGKTVKLECKPVEGYESASFTSDEVTITDGTFVMGDKNVNVKVTFTGKEYTLSLSLNGGYYENEPEGWTPIESEGRVTGYSRIFRCGETVVLPTETPQKKGYTFSVWSGGIPVIMPSKDTNLKASYYANTYKLLWMNEGKEYLVQYALYDSVITAPSSPTKQATTDFSYSFDRWNGFKTGMTVTGDETFDALYKAVAKTYLPSSTGKIATITTDTYSAGVPMSVTDKIQQDINNKAIDSMLITLCIGKVNLNGDTVLTIKDNMNFGIYEASTDDIKESQIQIVGDRPIFKFESDLGDKKITVSFKYELRDGEDSKGLYILYLKDDGECDRINGTYSGGYFSFDIDHNSLFSLMYEKPAAEDNTNVILYVCIGLGVLLVLILLVYALKRRKKKIDDLN